MRSCMWITSAVGSSDSAASRATGVAAAALSLSSAPTTAYPVIFFSILTAMTRFLVCLLVCGAWCGAGVGRERALTPTPLPLRRRGALERYFFPATLRVAFLRSEEHTSELQSLMRISYAVFCLKKKKLHH